VDQTDPRWARRARSFGAVAREYDRTRPSYPDELVDDVLALLPGRRVVEVGAGTGKATRLFAARGLAMTCIEPDADMAAVLAENVVGFPDVGIVVSPFEQYESSEPFDGLVAGQSWHWVPRATGYDKAASLLRPGGVFAVFWNEREPGRNPLSPRIDEIYRRAGAPRDNGEPNEWVRDQLDAHPDFRDVELRSYRRTDAYTTRQWCDYVATTSDHLIMEPELSRAVLAEVAAVIDEAGGTMTVHVRTDLFLARRI
jgi:SAM-dependent methyltransferase